MNELRMYVEHLFEGKVLTTENIELKEEIYGNLVARYEDLIADGLDEDEALRRTKESITSIDDVLNSVSDESDSGEDSTGAREMPTGVEDGVVTGETAAAPVDATVALPTPPAAVVEQDVREVSEKPSKRTHTFMVAALIVLALFILFGLGAKVLLDVVDDTAGDAQEGIVENTQHVVTADPATGNDTSSSATAPTPTKQNREIFVDESGQVWIDGEPGDELAEGVVNAGYGVIAEYADTDLADAAKVEALLRSLPMGEYVGDVDVTKGVDVLGLAYREVPETLDGDSVDAALAYDVTAVFCAMPLVNEIQVTLTESDEPLDESYYVFKRDDVQSRYGVRLDGEMVNEAGWHRIKEDNLYRRKFIEHMVDAAEREWK